ncbi:thioesterase family protein [Nakamurella antarctica]|uniref:Thioesterase family protein n=1 Tax=Nakamurella antarctica TaxID=1902245 RepID=A0A3G8ZYR2_9ACTN|nr:thioesterase family protein [Nakamurella antarctica]
MPAYYIPLGAGRYLPTIHAQGAWSEHEQHMSPVAGLLVHVMQACSPRRDLALARISFDILGFLPATEVDMSARILRPGKTIELVEAEMSVGGRTIARATGWRLLVSDTGIVAGTPLSTLAGPERASPWAGEDLWGGGFIRSLEFRTLPGRSPGTGKTWLRSTVDLVEGRESSDLEMMLAVVDTANGVSPRVPPSDYVFPNTDLTVHLFRQPQGRWLGMDTEVSLGPDGVGLTATALHDEHGPIGRSAQILTVRKR